MINNHSLGIEGESRRAALPLKQKRLEFSRYAGENPWGGLIMWHIILNIRKYWSTKK